MTLEATGRAGAVATFTATATDVVDGSRAVGCTPPSGATFGLGTTTVNCSSSDTHGNTANGSFNVVVRDTTPPTLQLPGPMTVEATGPSGATATFTATATDLVDGQRPVTCTPASGAAFAFGSTNVSCSSSDTHGNTADGAFTVLVRDTIPPQITISAPSGSYLLGQSVPASYSCSDSGSGVASCSGPVASGTNVDTATVGAKSFVVNAIDAVGNRSSASTQYSVGYAVGLLYDASKAKNSGSTYPIKIALRNAAGQTVSSSSIVVHALAVIRTSDNAPGVLDDSGSANPDLDFRYDASLGGYIFNLNLSGYATGTYTLQFTAGNDPAVHTAQFQVR
jgi:hypothetical protein